MGQGLRTGTVSCAQDAKVVDGRIHDIALVLSMPETYDMTDLVHV
jgi:hypothetical protein